MRTRRSSRGARRRTAAPAAPTRACSQDRLPGAASRSTSTTTRRHRMAELIAIGYPDETTALQALDEAQNLAQDLIIETDAAAAIVRHADGKYQVTTKHGPTAGGGATWGMFWGLLFGLLFFIPVFGMAVGAGLGALFGHLEKSTIDKEFQQQVRDMVQ